MAMTSMFSVFKTENLSAHKKACLAAMMMAVFAFLPSPARAVTGSDAAPGQACTVEDAVSMTSNPGGEGGYMLTCKGGTWRAQIITATPTNSSHAATKGYVDAAVASAAGGTGGGVCYEVDSALDCGTGFQNMGTKTATGVGTYKVCCTGGSSAGDVTAADFDFVDKTDLAYNQTYTWPAEQITQFDSATVSISGAGLQYRICADAACTNVLKAWKTAADIISDNQYLQIRYNTPFTSGVTLNFTVTVGDTSDSVTIYGDNTPDGFNFPNLTSVANPTVWATPIQITGIRFAEVSFGGADPLNMQYRICADSGCSSVIKNWGSSPDQIHNNEYLQIRHNNAMLIASKDFTVVIGTASDAVNQLGAWRVFITSLTYNGDLGGVSGADAKCAARATAAGFPGTYKAWLSTGAGDEPADRFANVGTSNPFYLVDNLTKVADNWSDLTDNSLDAPINITESGGGVGAVGVWTNTSGAGAVVSSSSVSNCIAFGNGTGSYSARTGRADFVASSWTNSTDVVCNATRNLYCFQTAP